MTKELKENPRKRDAFVGFYHIANRLGLRLTQRLSVHIRKEFVLLKVLKQIKRGTTTFNDPNGVSAMHAC